MRIKLLGIALILGLSGFAQIPTKPTEPNVIRVKSSSKTPCALVGVSDCDDCDSTNELQQYNLTQIDDTTFSLDSSGVPIDTITIVVPAGGSVEAFNGTQIDATTGRVELGDDVSSQVGGTPAVHISNRFQNITGFEHTWTSTNDLNLFSVYGNRNITNKDASSLTTDDVVSIGFPRGDSHYKLNIHGRTLIDNGRSATIIGATETVGATANADIRSSVLLGANQVATRVDADNSVLIGGTNLADNQTANVQGSVGIYGVLSLRNGNAPKDITNSFTGGGRDVMTGNADVNASIALGGHSVLRGGPNIQSSVALGGFSTLTFPDVNASVAIGGNASLNDVNLLNSVALGGQTSLTNIANSNSSILLGASGSLTDIQQNAGSIIIGGQGSVVGQGVLNDRISQSVVLAAVNGVEGFNFTNAAVVGGTGMFSNSTLFLAGGFGNNIGNNSTISRSYHFGEGSENSFVSRSILSATGGSGSYSTINRSGYFGGFDERNNGIGHGSEHNLSFLGGGANTGDYSSGECITALGTRAFEYGTGTRSTFIGCQSTVEWVGGATFSFVSGDWDYTNEQVSNASITAFIAGQGLMTGDWVTAKFQSGSIIRINGTVGTGGGVSFRVVDANTLEFNGDAINAVASVLEINANGSVDESTAIGYNSRVSRDREISFGNDNTRYYKLRNDGSRIYPNLAAALADITLEVDEIFWVEDGNGSTATQHIRYN